MKGLGKRIFGLCADTFGLNKRIQGPQALVLRLHRVLPESDFEKLRFQRQHALTEDGLDHLLTLLKRQYTLIQLDDYLQLDSKKLQLDSKKFARRDRFACLTFDDGWQDNYLYALPILKAHRAPASIYLATGHIGNNKQFWWQTLGDAFAETLRHPDKSILLQALLKDYGQNTEPADADALILMARAMPPEQRESLATALDSLCETHNSVGLNWEQAKYLTDTGLIRFGAQSVSHLPLSSLSDANMGDDIAQSRHILLQHPEIRFNNLFCYPHGVCNESAIRLAKENGYDGALSTFPSYASRQPRERFRLPRLNITEALARDPGLFNYRLLKAGTQRGRYAINPAPPLAPSSV